MAGSGEDFCLKWNDHHSLFFCAAENLCQSSMLTDVTLATSDQTFPAHKLVLSICSSFFRDLFSKPEFSSNSSSVVYLKDVSGFQLEKLLSYMYRGEINVEENDLIKLLQTAKGLGVKGLSEVDDRNTANFGKHKTINPQPSSNKLTPSKKKQKVEEIQPHHYEDVIEVAPPKEMIEVDDNLLADGLEVVEPNIENMNSHLDIAETEEGEGEWYDEEASYHGEDGEGFEHGTVNSKKTHPGAAGEELPLNCPQCPKTFASSWHLKRHVQTHSKEKRFKCDLCGKFFSRNDNLKSHQKTVHGLMLPPSSGSASKAAGADPLLLAHSTMDF